MKALGSNLVVELTSQLISTREFFRDVARPEVVHVETHHTAPFDVSLLCEGIQKRDLTLSRCQNHPDFFLTCQQLAHRGSDCGGCSVSQVELVSADSDFGFPVSHRWNHTLRTSASSASRLVNPTIEG